MSRERRYKTLNLLLVASVGAVIGFAVANGLYLAAVLTVLMGLILSGVIKWFHQDVITEDERTTRIGEKASAQALNLFLAGVGLTYIVLVFMRAIGMQINNLFTGFMPLAYTALSLILIRYIFYLYYRRKM